MLRAFLDGFTVRKRATWQQQEPPPRTDDPQKTTEDGQAKDADVADKDVAETNVGDTNVANEISLKVYLFIPLGSVAVVFLAHATQESFQKQTETPYKRREPRDEGMGSPEKGAEYGVADVYGSRSPEISSAYEFEADVRNVITVVKIQVGRLSMVAPHFRASPSFWFRRTRMNFD